MVSKWDILVILALGACVWLFLPPPNTKRD